MLKCKVEQGNAWIGVQRVFRGKKHTVYLSISVEKFNPDIIKFHAGSITQEDDKLGTYQPSPDIPTSGLTVLCIQALTGVDLSLLRLPGGNGELSQQLLNSKIPELLQSPFALLA